MNGPISRMKSPRPGCSILTTSAPCSPSSPAQNGAAIRVPRSRTRRPARGPLTEGMVLNLAMRLNQVTVAVSDVARAVDFYTDIGLQLIVRGGSDGTDSYARF